MFFRCFKKIFKDYMYKKKKTITGKHTSRLMYLDTYLIYKISQMCACVHARVCMCVYVRAHMFFSSNSLLFVRLCMLS